MLFAFQALTAVPDSAWQLLVTANLTTKIVLGVTAVLSLYSWFVMGLKYWQFRRLRRQANRFFQALEGAPRLPDAYRVALKLPASPFTKLFREAMHFYEEIFPGANREGPEPGRSMTPTQLEALKLVLGKEVGAERDVSIRLVPTLGTIGAVSPLLGLLGTVLGVMHAFLGMGQKGSGNIAAVAPGIAEALITTVAGIAAAIPALMAYNYFVAKATRFEGDLDGFANGLIGWMAREGWV
ncbi:MAG: MotA/TolQ/ExbB proton channel family protein [Gemmatimonadales bacterium]